MNEAANSVERAPGAPGVELTVDDVLGRLAELSARARREISALEGTISQLERLGVEIEQHRDRIKGLSRSTPEA